MNKLRKLYIDIRYYWFKFLYPSPKIHSIVRTLEDIIASKKSIARFGDGEFHLIGRSEGIGFQVIDRQLSERLIEVLQSKSDCLICLPEGLQSIDQFRPEGHFFWKQFWVFHYRKYIRYIDAHRVYHNANLTRPYMDYRDTSGTKKYFERMKDLWLDKNVLIVEGEMTRMGVGNDLFDSARSIHRVLTYSQNAFSVYDQLYNCIKNVVCQYDLVLIALGPTATVLAYDISKLNVQAIDIGHIDLEYEWFCMGSSKKVALSGKHVNELSYQVESGDCPDMEYHGQIIFRCF